MPRTTTWPPVAIASALALALATTTPLAASGQDVRRTATGPAGPATRWVAIGPLRLAWRPLAAQATSPAPPVLDLAASSERSTGQEAADPPVEPVTGPSLVSAAPDESFPAESAAEESPAPDDSDAANGERGEKSVGKEVVRGGAEGQETTPGEPQDEAAAAAQSTPAVGADADAEADEGPPPRPPLSEAMVKLRDQLRQTLARHAQQPLSTGRNTPADVLLFCLPFGCDTTIIQGTRSARRISALGALCWNYPCAGMRLLSEEAGRVVARVGYGLQSQPSQLLATLALARVPRDYEVRVGDFHGGVADLVESEKLHCYRGQDLALTLLGLAFYVDDDLPWENALGQTWSLERLVAEELDRQVVPDDCQATNRLLGLSFALDRRRRRGQPLDGPYARAEDYIHNFQEFALGLENPDGTWHPRYFAARGGSSDATGQLRATGHILAWLVTSLPEDRLEEPALVKSVAYLADALGNQRSGWRKLPATPRSLDALMHSLHALALYDQRVFRPRDAQPADEAPQTGPAPEETSR